jgi:hypothetical protein
MSHIIFKKILPLVVLITMVACTEEEEVKPQRTPLTIPSQYDSTSFITNTATERSVLAALSEQVKEANRGRGQGVVVLRTALENLYTTGSPSLKAVSTTYFAGKMEGSGGFMDELAKSSGGTFTPGDTSGQGGKFGPYLFDEFGLEHEQLIEKGQFGAVLYKHATDLMAGNINVTTSDKLLAIFGTTPLFPNTNNASKTPAPDRFMANYAARRDKNDGQGLYSQMKAALIKLQAATKAGADYQQEQQEALATIADVWDRINVATIINYCHQATASLNKTNPTDADKSSALHALGEGIGFAHGWKTIPTKYRKISDAQIDEILVLLKAPPNGNAAVYKFATNPVSELPKLQQVITKLKDLYGFSNQQIEDFKNNWVTVQNR